MWFRFFTDDLFPELRTFPFDLLIESFYFVAILLTKLFYFLDLSRRIHFTLCFLNLTLRKVFEICEILSRLDFKAFAVFKFLNKRKVRDEIFLTILLQHSFELLKHLEFRSKFYCLFKVLREVWRVDSWLLQSLYFRRRWLSQLDVGLHV